MRLKYSTLKKLEQLYKSDDFQIEARSNDFEGEHFMLRFGYWAEVNFPELIEVFKPLGFIVQMSEWEDDDCGWLYSYNIKNKSYE